MKEEILLAGNVLACRASRFLNKPLSYPLNVSLSVTDRCNSRCKTCNVWKRKAYETELSTWEWEQILMNIGHPYWISISGGEPMMRPDIADILLLVEKIVHPKKLSIATNGLLPETTLHVIERLLASRAGQTIVNLSIDEVDEKYTSVRGIDGFEKVKKTLYLLKGIQSKKLIVGVNIVLSRHNEERLPYIYERVMELDPDSVICEVAQEKKAIYAPACSPKRESVIAAVTKLLGSDSQKKKARLIRSLRDRYYRLVLNQLDGKKIDCFAGIASCIISPHGKVLNCSVRADCMGDLREDGYDFRKTWKSALASDSRDKARGCYCSDAGSNYVNILCNCRP
ncbi:MAG: radical SAM protein [Nanoarchaeota archaeon]|nr:radical SAM protein [Nanoarchaeota archaeon]